MSRPDSDVRLLLAERLSARRTEIEHVILTRVYGIANTRETTDESYTDGLQVAIRDAVDYGLEAIELGEDRTPDVPPALLAQARLAARNGVSLETVLRRYFAGYVLLGDFVVEETQRGGLIRGDALRRLLRSHAGLLDRLLEAIASEYAEGAASTSLTTEQRRAEQVERLLAGELLDTSKLEYPFGDWHLGVVAAGIEPGQETRRLAEFLDCRLLLVPRADAIWIWMATRERLDPERAARALAAIWPSPAPLAIGEPGHGLSRWRLTHQQARAAAPIAVRRSAVVRYADVALLTSMLKDDLLAASLREMYLKPLDRERDGGRVARETLRAYFAAGRNASSAGAALGVSRNTVTNRLRALEAKLGQSIEACAAELDAALRLESLHQRTASDY